MKQFFLLFFALTIFCSVFAQTVPQGMKYQAVARDTKGQVLANQKISLKINLVTGTPSPAVYYSEVHDIITNELGLFTLVIGEGSNNTGVFKDVPWSTQDIWMQVAIKDKNATNFTTISNSKLLAVPYAFHAATASQLVNGSSNGNANRNGAGGGVPSAVWSLKGNSKTNPLTDNLGTSDYADLVIVTNDIERLRITADGNAIFKNKVEVGGIETVTNKTASTDPATGALVVSGGVGIGGDLNVGGAFNAKGGITSKGITVTDNTENFVATITNTNSGNGDGLKIKLGRIQPLWNGTAYESIQANDFNSFYQAFQPQIDLVGGWIKNQKVDVQPSDLLQLGKSTGLFLAGALCQLTNAISPTLNQKLGLPLDLATPINSQLKLPLNLAAPLNSTLKLPLNLAAPINSALNLPNNLATPINSGLGLPYKIAGETVIPGLPDLTIPGIPASSLTVPAIPDYALTIPAIPKQYLTIPAIPQIDCSGLPTIKLPNIKTTDVTNSLTHENEFLRFADKDERIVGMVRAQSLGDFYQQHTSNAYLFHLVSAVGGIDIAKGLLSLAGEFYRVSQDYNTLGVEYVSGHGDYAEWMERSNLEEAISPGDIVGVKGGKITKELRGAEQIMAVSTAPIVNANMPVQARVGLGNSIAFMGQIPVKIIGPVTTGDFIVAKGELPGYGVAVKSSEMTTEDFRLVVGRAWETINVDGPKMVNTLVGVQNNDFLKIIQKYQEKVMSAEHRVASTEERLNAIEQKLNMNSARKNSKKK